MSATGGMARECSKFYSCLSETIAEKRDQPYSIVSWIRRKISFSFIRSFGMCIGGSRSVTSSDDLLTSATNDAVPSELTFNIVLISFFLPFYLKFVIGKKLL